MCTTSLYHTRLYEPALVCVCVLLEQHDNFVCAFPHSRFKGIHEQGQPVPEGLVGSICLGCDVAPALCRHPRCMAATTSHPCTRPPFSLNVCLLGCILLCLRQPKAGTIQGQLVHPHHCQMSQQPRVTTSFLEAVISRLQRTTTRGCIPGAGLGNGLFHAAGVTGPCRLKPP